jgi:hypothetical protein
MSAGEHWEKRPQAGPLTIVKSANGTPKCLLFPGLAKHLSTVMVTAMQALPWTPTRSQINMGAWKKNRFKAPQQVAFCNNKPAVWKMWQTQQQPLCSLLASTNSQYFPKENKLQMELCSKVESEGMSVCAPFTTVTLNAGRAADGKPHHHRENAKGIMQWLAYFGEFKGGKLCLPDFDCTLRVRDGDVVAFLGEEIVHSVLPFEGERFCFVYWVCGGLWKWYMV